MMRRGKVCSWPLKQRSFSCNRGFTLLELTVVVVIIGVLFLVALSRLMSLQVDAERVTMEMQAGALRSALALQVVKHFAQQDQRRLAELVFVNPMEHLVEFPPNYLGEFEGKEPEAIEGGNWYYDKVGTSLVYRVKNGFHFKSALKGAPRARFRVIPVFDNDAAQRKGERIVGLRLSAIEPYRWLSKSSKF